MNERRRDSRSENPEEALGLMLDAVKARSDVSAVAVVDSEGRVVRGVGDLRQLEILGLVAQPVAMGLVSDACERMTVGTDVMARACATARGTMYLAALGSRVRRMHEAARSVERIVARHVAA